MRFLYALTLLLIAVGLGVSQAQAQSAEDVLDEVTESIVTGNSDRLARFFSDRVEITVMGKRQVLSSTQAIYVIKQFYGNYPADRFTILHRGNTNGTLYALGMMKSQKGDFEVNIFIQLSSTKISEMRFEKNAASSRY